MNLQALPKVTTGLLLFSLYVALVSQLGRNLEALQPFFISWYLEGGLQEVKQGQFWRLVTPIFIHFGLVHLVFNSIMTWQLGEVIERYLGPLRFLGLVLMLSIISNLAQFYTSGPLFGGLSGVLYGLFGYFWIAGKYNPLFRYQINPSAVRLLLGWFALCWFDFFGLLGDIKMANMAHTGGLLMGMLVAYISALQAKSQTHQH